MPIKFEVELDDQDLAQFQRMIDAKGVGSQVEVPDIVQATSELLDSARQAETPRFILEKLEQLEPLVAMVTDSEWRLPTDDIRRVLDALAYLADPADLIPDEMPGFGYLDDAVIVELACRNLRPELEAYQDFCAYRKDEEARRRAAGDVVEAVSRGDWLEARRKDLQNRMHQRRGLFGRRSR
jgi:uncharacterized membrane protein YkvA (DUF1232 family)